MPDTFDPDLRYCRPGQIAQQHPPQSIAQSGAEALFQRLGQKETVVILALCKFDPGHNQTRQKDLPPRYYRE
jgi:hypothetical protein